MSVISKIFGKKEQKFEEIKFPFFYDKSLKALSERLINKIRWGVPGENVAPAGDLFNSWREIPGAHKWHHYFSIYEKIFYEYKQRPIKILEIGVYKGASITMWRKFFHKDTKIVGIDIDPACSQFDDNEKNIFIRIGSQADDLFLKKLVDEFGCFDIIIDDGSHITSHMIASFNYLFINGLKENGIYFVEDTHSNYWETHRDTDVSFVDVAKSLVDMMHYHYTIGVREIDFRLGAEQQIKEFIVPKLTTVLEEIRFFDSIIVLYKKHNRTVPVSEHL